MRRSTRNIGNSIFTVLAELSRGGRNMGAKLDRIGEELAKARAKRAELDAKIRELERKYREAENTEIHELVHEANLTPRQLAELIQQAKKAVPNPEVLEQIQEENEYED